MRVSKQLALPLFVLAILVLRVSSASAAGTVAWVLRGVPEPTRFAPSDAARCEKSAEHCDRYQLLPMNVGNIEFGGTITIKDKLPSGLTTAQAPESHREAWACPEGRGGTEVTCTYDEGSITPGRAVPPLTVYVTAPPASSLGKVLKNEVTVEGGGAVATASEETLVSEQAPSFGLSEFTFEVGTEDGGESLQAGAHPWQVTANLELPLVETTPPRVAGEEETSFVPVESWKSAAVELPLGLIGDPQTGAQCRESELEREECPAASSVGSVEIGTGVTGDRFSISGEEFVTTLLYNMVPEGGYPAEFGFVTDEGTSVDLYASVVHSAAGYRLRVASPGFPGGGVNAYGAVLTFYGDPARVKGKNQMGPS